MNTVAEVEPFQDRDRGLEVVDVSVVERDREPGAACCNTADGRFAEQFVEWTHHADFLEHRQVFGEVTRRHRQLPWINLDAGDAVVSEDRGTAWQAALDPPRHGADPSGGPACHRRRADRGDGAHRSSVRGPRGGDRVTHVG